MASDVEWRPSDIRSAMASRPVTVQETVKFGECEVDLRSHTVCRAGRALKLERIPTEILVYLIEQRGELVSREQIVERIWGKDVFLDTDNSINGAIRKIRRALKDDPERPRYIQTITGRGYRFIARPIKSEEQVAPEAAVEAPAHSHPRPAEVLRAEPSRRLWIIPAAIVGLLLLMTGAWSIWKRVDFRTQPVSRAMLAVLPFENLTGDVGQEYFSDGLTEEMITRLGRLDPQHLGVIARTSVMTYKRRSEQVGAIGRELSVEYVLEGSVRRDSGRVRIAARLIRVKDQTDVWAREYDRDAQAILVIQAEIAQEIADEIDAALSVSHQRISPVTQNALSPTEHEAYDLYLKGRYFWNKRNIEGFQQAITSFQQAINKDPNYAQAYAGLADSYALMGTYNQAPSSVVMPKARAAAMKALSINENLAEAHVSLALITETYDWDWQTAEKEFRRAIELDPNYATAHHWYAEYLSFQGRFDEAFAESNRARQLDPLSLIIAVDDGAILYFSRQYDRAIERLRAALEMEPGFGRAHLVIGAYVQTRRFKDAMADIEAWRRTSGDAPWIWSSEAFVYGRAGDTARARYALRKLQESNRSWHMDPMPLFDIAYAGTATNDEWLTWLEKACDAHSNVLTDLKVDPMYDPLRNEPRFHRLLHRVGLEQ
jgi:TolB-like protein/DNA-binding winged helix-turn-helix (wHTH) protein/Tfp pilus assembly protein PilF